MLELLKSLYHIIRFHFLNKEDEAFLAKKTKAANEFAKGEIRVRTLGVLKSKNENDTEKPN